MPPGIGQGAELDGLIAGLRAGESRAVRQFCDAYGPALQRMAERRMAQALRRRTEPEDVLQSVYRTFFRRAADGQFQLDDANDLWRLMCAITLTKVREKARFHFRQRRGVDREVMMDATPDGAAQLGDSGPSPHEHAVLTEAMAQLLDGLAPQEQRVVDLKLQDVPNHEVAARLGCSERTVRRLLGRLRQRFRQVLDAE